MAPDLPRPAAIKGRGTPIRIAHRFEREAREAFDDGWGQLDQLASIEQVPPQTEVIEEHAKSILSSNDSPDVPFTLSINPSTKEGDVAWSDLADYHALLRDYVWKHPSERGELRLVAWSPGPMPGSASW